MKHSAVTIDYVQLLPFNYLEELRKITKKAWEQPVSRSRLEPQYEG